MYQKVLVVDPRWTTAARIKRALESRFPFEVDIADSFGKIRALLSGSESTYGLAVLNLNLADGEPAPVLEFVSAMNVPSVIVSDRFPEEIHKAMPADNIVDYLIPKQGRILSLIVDSIEQYLGNERFSLLVVEAGADDREVLLRLLRRRNYRVDAVDDGPAAMRALEDEEGRHLVLVGERLPSGSGIALTHSMRARFGKEKLAILGLTGEPGGSRSAQFLKAGANDFLHRPFAIEELYCRVAQNLDIVALFDRVSQASRVDPLTAVFNRSYLHDIGSRVYKRAKLAGTPMALAILDVDCFRKVNDVHGHEVGDLCLAHLAELLRRNFRASDIVARSGGEEFCMLMTAIQPRDAAAKMEALRKQIADRKWAEERGPVTFSVSIGLVFDYGNELGDMVAEAERKLATAKRTGGNKVVALT